MLLIVLLVVAMLALGAYSFTRLMNIEAQGAKSYGRLVQAREAADSGVHYVAAILTYQKLTGSLGSDLYDAPSLFQAIAVSDELETDARLRCRFSIVSPATDGETANALRFGLTDEAGRLHLNALPSWTASQSSETTSGTGTSGSAASAGTSTVNPLSYLPNMTPEIADAILDWIDSDDEPRENGVESDYYQSLDPPYWTKNGPLDSLDELLLIKGITPRLLYGEDTNRNGLLDANEDDGAASYPTDDANGTLDRGWLPYLTIHSHESNQDMFGESRINLNGDDLAGLFEEIRSDLDFDEEAATFVVAYRLFGPASSESSESSSGESSSGSSGGGSGGGAATTSGGNATTGSSSTSTTEAEIIAGMDASGGAKFQIDSVVDLIGATVNAQMQGEEQPRELKSPFETEAMSDYLDVLLDRATTSTKSDFAGRVNVNSAPVEVLLGIPGMSEVLADEIVAARPQADETGAGTFDAGVGWLLASDTVTTDEFKQMEPYITGRSQVFRVQSVGHFESGGPVARVEAVIDVTGSSPRVSAWTDLSPLGRGYERQLLLGNFAR